MPSNLLASTRSDKSEVMPIVVPANANTSKPQKKLLDLVRAVSRLKHYRHSQLPHFLLSNLLKQPLAEPDLPM